MSTNQPTREEDRRSDLAVMGANEYKQKRRLQRILDAHDAVEETAAESWDKYVNGDITHDAKNIAIQKAVKQSIREAYNLLIEYVNDNGKQEPYWNGNGEAIDEITFQKQDPVEIHGLADFLATKEMYEEQWTEPVDRRHGVDETVSRTASHTVPEELSWAVFLRLKEFLSQEQDLEIRFEEIDDSLPKWGFEEVDEDDGDD